MVVVVATKWFPLKGLLAKCHFSLLFTGLLYSKEKCHFAKSPFKGNHRGSSSKHLKLHMLPCLKLLGRLLVKVVSHSGPILSRFGENVKLSWLFGPPQRALLSSITKWCFFITCLDFLVKTSKSELTMMSSTASLLIQGCFSGHWPELPRKHIGHSDSTLLFTMFFTTRLYKPPAR